MVNFEPGEYMGKMIFQSLTQAAGKKTSQFSKQESNLHLQDLLVTKSRRLKGDLWELRPLN